jgi:signal transduction histidine kinase
VVIFSALIADPAKVVDIVCMARIVHTGISTEEQDKIFEKFYRGREGRSGGSGTGMGLAIAKRIIEEHGGTISVTSTPGSGAVFSTVLPIWRREEG